MSDDCDVILLSENFAVLWLAFLHSVAAVEVVFYAKFGVIEYRLRDPLQRLRQMHEMLHAETTLLHVLTNQSLQNISFSNL
jgi:hypothetical protein